MRMRELLEGKTTKKVDATKPRNFVAKNAISTGAGAHKDKKKAEKQGDVKHKAKQFEQDVAEGSGGDQYKIKSIGHDSKGDYYISPSTGKKIYKSGVKRGDHENPKTGEHKSVAEGIFGIDSRIKGKIQNITSDLSDVPGMWDHKAQTFTSAGMEKLKSALNNNPKYIKYALNLNYKDYEAEGVAEGAVKNLMMDLRAMTDQEFQARYKMTKTQARAELRKSTVKETATAGGTSAGNVAVGAVYKNQKGKTFKNKDGTAKNALDVKGANLMTGGSIKR